MKKRIISSLLAMTASCLLIGGATFALFTTSAANNNNSLQAATLEIDVERDRGDTPPGPIFYTTVDQGGGTTVARRPTGLWAPGDSNERLLNVINKSATTTARLTRIKAIIGGVNGTALEEFKNHMKLEVKIGSYPTIISEQPLVNYLGNGLTVSAPNPDDLLILPSPNYPLSRSILDLTFKATLDGAGTGNALQGQTPTVSFVVYAEQAHN